MTQTNQSSTLGAQTTKNVTYGIMPEQVTKQLQDAGNHEFIVITRTRGSSEPQVWSSGDPSQTQNLFRSAYTALAFKEPVSA